MKVLNPVICSPWWKRGKSVKVIIIPKCTSHSIRHIPMELRPATHYTWDSMKIVNPGKVYCVWILNEMFSLLFASLKQNGKEQKHLKWQLIICFRNWKRNVNYQLVHSTEIVISTTKISAVIFKTLLPYKRTTNENPKHFSTQKLTSLLHIFFSALSTII